MKSLKPTVTTKYRWSTSPEPENSESAASKEPATGKGWLYAQIQETWVPQTRTADFPVSFYEMTATSEIQAGNSLTKTMLGGVMNKMTLTTCNTFLWFFFSVFFRSWFSIIRIKLRCRQCQRDRWWVWSICQLHRGCSFRQWYRKRGYFWDRRSRMRRIRDLNRRVDFLVGDIWFGRRFKLLPGIYLHTVFLGALNETTSHLPTVSGGPSS